MSKSRKHDLLQSFQNKLTVHVYPKTQPCSPKRLEKQRPNLIQTAHVNGSSETNRPKKSVNDVQNPKISWYANVISESICTWDYFVMNVKLDNGNSNSVSNIIEMQVNVSTFTSLQAYDSRYFQFFWAPNMPESIYEFPCGPDVVLRVISASFSNEQFQCIVKPYWTLNENIQDLKVSVTLVPCEVVVINR